MADSHRTLLPLCLSRRNQFMADDDREIIPASTTTETALDVAESRVRVSKGSHLDI